MGRARWAGPSAHKKDTGRVKKFNPPTPYSPVRQARWPVEPTRGLKRASPRPVQLK